MAGVRTLLARRVFTYEDGLRRLGNPLLARALSWPLWYLPAVAFVTGPVVLGSLYAFMVRSGNFIGRPLTSFASATVGDWLLLPLLVTLCALSLGHLGRIGFGRLGRVSRWVPAVWALLGTASLNLVWLSDAGNANWTQPAIGGPFGLPLWFNAAGWLHVAFFVLIQWWVAEFVLRLGVALWQMRSKAGELPALSSVELSALLVEVNIMLAAGLVFGVLLAWDYWARIVAPSATQTWAWLLTPVFVLIMSSATNYVLFERLDAPVDSNSQRIYRREGFAVIVWVVPLLAMSVTISVAVAPSVFAELGLLPLSCVALAAYAPYNVWAETYDFQRGRKTDWFSLVGLAAIGMLILAGFMLSLYMLIQQGPAPSLEAIIAPWLLAFGVAMAACFGAAGLGVMLANREAHHPDWPPQTCKQEGRRRMSCHFGAESPQHDVIQNVAQFGLLHGLLPMFAAAYVMQALPLLQRFDLADQLSTHISLMFGYAGVAVAAVTFPLYNNMSHIRRLEEELKVEHEKAEPNGDLLDYLKADKDFTMFLCIAIGVIAALAAMWMWIKVLDSILAVA